MAERAHTNATVTGGYGAEFEGSMAQRWRELHGAKNWDGLLTLDEDLRKELLRYGGFAQVAEDAFPWEPKSRFPFACPYKKKELLEEVGLPATRYEVTRYLYSYLRGNKLQGPVQEINWIGYVAVTVCPQEINRLGRREIIVSWRGTRTDVEWSQVILFGQIQITPINGTSAPEGVKVDEGFWRAFADEDGALVPYLSKGSAGKQATQEVKRLLQKYEGEEMSITCVGHSLGGALAQYCAYQIAEDGINQTASGTVPVAAITFASPRVGTTDFRDRFESLGVKHLRVKVNQDIVTCLPLGHDEEVSTPILDVVKKVVTKTAKTMHVPDMFGFLVSKLIEATEFDGYAHLGTTLSLDFTKSEYLKQAGKAADVDNSDMVGNHHNLQAYLHLVNGVVGTDEDLEKGFSSVLPRDLALINRSADVLADPYAEHIPGKWWKMKNSGLIRNGEGFYEYPDIFNPPLGTVHDYD